MKLQNLLGTSAFILSLAGCEEPQPLKPNLAEEYNSEPAAFTEKVEAVSQLEGRIVKVQPSQISYVGAWQGINGGYVSANHEFEYVLVEDANKKLHTLIYPYSKAIIEREAILKFRLLPSGTIDTEKFIDNFLKQEYFTDDIFDIEAEGIIIKEGIKYR